MLGTNLRICSIAVAGVLAGAWTAPAQSIPLTPVEENVADVSPLRASLRSLEPDHGWATGFERVYQSPLYPDKFIRVHGAVWAMFPMSEYVDTENGALPVIPASAEFFIGPPPLPTQPPESAPGGASSNFVSLLSTSRYLGVDEPRESRSTRSRSAVRAEPLPARYLTVWSGSEHRARRLDAILRQARDAAAGESTGR